MRIKCCMACTTERHPGCGDNCGRYRTEKEAFKAAHCKRHEDDEINEYQRRIISDNRCKGMRY